MWCTLNHQNMLSFAIKFTMDEKIKCRIESETVDYSNWLHFLFLINGPMEFLFGFILLFHILYSISNSTKKSEQIEFFLQDFRLKISKILTLTQITSPINSLILFAWVVCCKMDNRRKSTKNFVAFQKKNQRTLLRRNLFELLRDLREGITNTRLDDTFFIRKIFWGHSREKNDNNL